MRHKQIITAAFLLTGVAAMSFAGPAKPGGGSVTGVQFCHKGRPYPPPVLAFQTNQELKVVNDDQTSHNIHPLAKVNHEWNKSQPPGTPPLSEKFAQPEFIPVKCNVHPWMHGNFAVLKNSHYEIG